MVIEELKRVYRGFVKMLMLFFISFVGILLWLIVLEVGNDLIILVIIVGVVLLK